MNSLTPQQKALYERCVKLGWDRAWRDQACVDLAKILKIPPPPWLTTTSTRPTAQSTAGGAGGNAPPTTPTQTPPQATNPSPSSSSNGSPPPNTTAIPPVTPDNTTPQGDSGAPTPGAPTSSQPSATDGPQTSPTPTGSTTTGLDSGVHPGSDDESSDPTNTMLPWPYIAPTETGSAGATSPTKEAGSGDSGLSLSVGNGNQVDAPSATNTFTVEGVGAAGKKSNTGAIVGGVLGALAILALLILALLLMRRRRRRARVAPSSEFMQRFANSPSLQTTPRASGAPYSDDQTNLPSYSQGQYPFVVHEKTPMYP